MNEVGRGRVEDLVGEGRVVRGPERAVPDQHVDLRPPAARHARQRRDPLRQPQPHVRKRLGRRLTGADDGDADRTRRGGGGGQVELTDLDRRRRVGRRGLRAVIAARRAGREREAKLGAERGAGREDAVEDAVDPLEILGRVQDDVRDRAAGRRQRPHERRHLGLAAGRDEQIARRAHRRRSVGEPRAVDAHEVVRAVAPRLDRLDPIDPLAVVDRARIFDPLRAPRQVVGKLDPRRRERGQVDERRQPAVRVQVGDERVARGRVAHRRQVLEEADLPARVSSLARTSRTS